MVSQGQTYYYSTFQPNFHHSTPFSVTSQSHAVVACLYVYTAPCSYNLSEADRTLTKKGEVVNNPGRYVVLEGPDGAGKGVQLSLLQEALRVRGISVVVVIEPGGDSLGQIYRSILKGQPEDAFIRQQFAGRAPHLSPVEAVCLFNAARARLVSYIIEQLALGHWVLSDRNWISTIAYQVFGDQLDIDQVEPVCQFAMQGLAPDLVLILHAEYQLTSQRTQARGGTDRFESSGGDYLRRVSHGYAIIADRYDIPIIPADRTPEQIAQDIWTNHTEPLLKEA